MLVLRARNTPSRESGTARQGQLPSILKPVSLAFARGVRYNHSLGSQTFICAMLARTTWLLAIAMALILVTRPAFAADEPKPLKILLIAGGCCHDYAKQKDILKKGIEARANSVVDITYVADGSTHPA